MHRPAAAPARCIHCSARISFAALLLSSFACPVAAQDLSREPVARNLEIRREGEISRVELAIGWVNAWRNERNRDAAWVVLRSPDPKRGPLKLAASGHTVTGEIDGAFELSEDRLGGFLAASQEHRGRVEWRVSLVLDEPAPEKVTAWAVGMVFIPAGGFELGDDDPLVVRYGAFHRVGPDGSPAGPLRVESESSIRIAKEPGALWYLGDQEGYRGDQLGPIPAEWPKGARAFYLMKHELTQGQYATFLNALPAAWQERRAPIALEGEETDTCSIVRDGDRWIARAPDRPCNFVSWDDSCAYFDWLALRPITELEFEKAARGPQRPVPGDYPWGTASMQGLERRVTRTRDLAKASAADEAALNDAERTRLGASYFWVMDLSGSVWERVISAGHPIGRAFAGSHGDGVLAESGNATNADWPHTEADGENAPGMGFRGGAEYWKEPRADDPTNPCSRTATRTYAGWGGANRYKTYSARGARSAPSSSDRR